MAVFFYFAASNVNLMLCELKFKVNTILFYKFTQSKYRTMTNDENKMYVLKVNYSVIDVSKKKSKRKITRKKEKLYLVKDPETIEDKLKELEDTLLEIESGGKTTLIEKAQDLIKRFGNRCNTTYYSMLRT